MSLNLVKDIRSAYGHLNPHDVHALSRRDLSVGLAAMSEAGYEALERFFIPDAAAADFGLKAVAALKRVGPGAAPNTFDFIVCEEDMPCPKGAIIFHPNNPAATREEILDAYQELEIPISRHFLSFREAVITRIIQRTSKENALFSLVTALPNVLPNFLELPWAVGEFATDTAFLTINQVRMAFLIAAANEKPVGYGAQKFELATIVAGAFGWRAIARELVGKIPLGGGLIPKAGIAFAGTYAVGLSLERYHRTGYSLNRKEHRQAYNIALERGKGIVENLLSGLKKRPAA